MPISAREFAQLLEWSSFTFVFTAKKKKQLLRFVAYTSKCLFVFGVNQLFLFLFHDGFIYKLEKKKQKTTKRRLHDRKTEHFKAIIYQLSLIISLPRAITSNGIILTF